MPDNDKGPLQATDISDALAEDGRTTRLRNLDRVLVRGVAWTAGVKWLVLLFTWTATIVIARLLIPSDYGLVGMAALYINLFTLFSEFGIGTAVVAIQSLTEDQISQLNSLSVILGFIGFAISAIAAVPLGKFFRAPELPAVVLVLSFGFIVSGIRTIPYSLLQKELRFKLLAVIEGLQGVVQALVSLLLAFWGFGYWALVLGILSFSVTPTLLVLVFRRHRFSFPRLSAIGKAIHYSGHLVIGRLCLASYDDSDFIVAGRVLGASSLGAYTLAWNLAHSPLEKLTTLVNRVTPSVFAKIQTDSGALRRYLRNISGAMALIIFPATVGIALVAPQFVLLVLGSKWLEVTVPLQLLAMHALFRSNVILLPPLLNVVGGERVVMWASVVAMFALPLSFYTASRWGTVGIASAWLLVYPLTQIPLFVRALRRTQLSLTEYLGALWPAISGCLVLGLSIAALKVILRGFLPLPVQFVSEIFAGALVYGAVLATFHRGFLRDILHFLRSSR